MENEKEHIICNHVMEKHTVPCRCVYLSCILHWNCSTVLVTCAAMSSMQMTIARLTCSCTCMPIFTGPRNSHHVVHSSSSRLSCRDKLELWVCIISQLCGNWPFTSHKIWYKYIVSQLNGSYASVSGPTKMRPLLAALCLLLAYLVYAEAGHQCRYIPPERVS